MSPRTLAMLNLHILHSSYTFKRGSPLQPYLMRKLGALKDSYTLKEILVMLKDIIRDEEMFDMSNPAFIQGDGELTVALGKQIVHVTEIREIVYLQLTKLPAQQSIAPQPEQPSQVMAEMATGSMASLNREVMVSQQMPTGLGQAPQFFCEQIDRLYAILDRLD